MPQFRQVFHRFAHAVVGDIVGGGLGPPQQVVADILLDEAVLVVTPFDGVGQIKVFNDGLKLTGIGRGDFAAEDDGELVGLANGPVGIQQPFSQLVQGGTPPEDEIVAVLDLREEQAVLAAGLFAFFLGEERRQIGQPLLSALDQVVGGQGVGQFLQGFGIATAEESIAALAEADALFSQTQPQPVMLIQTNSS